MTDSTIAGVGTTTNVVELIERLLNARVSEYRNLNYVHTALGTKAATELTTLLERCEKAEARAVELDHSFTIEWTRAREFLNRAEAAEVQIKALTETHSIVCDGFREQVKGLERQIAYDTRPSHSEITELKLRCNAAEARVKELELRLIPDEIVDGKPSITNEYGGI